MTTEVESPEVEVISDPVSDFLKLTVLENPYIPIVPTIPQARFLVTQEDEALYGGAAGGGKSVALLAGALQFAFMPNYDSLILRRSFPDLMQPKALIPLSFEWLHGKARWNSQEHRWYFRSGATLTFGFIDNEKDKYKYQGPAFDYVGFDELTQFTQSQYAYLFSRIRRRIDSKIPGRMRAASNPGGDGHDWVKTRFRTASPNTTHITIDDETGDHRSSIFIPARLQDNPHIDRADYRRKLGFLDLVTRTQLEKGDWDILPEGNMFKRAWFKTVDALPADIVQTVRAWDLAATPVSPSNPDPDHASGVKMSRTRSGRFVIHNAKRLRGGPAEVESLLYKTAGEDGRGVLIRIEQEPGASGKIVVFNYAKALAAYDCRPVLPTGDKVVRASPLSAACERGEVDILRGAWNTDFLNILVGFPGLTHDDPVDAAAHAYNTLTDGLDMEFPTPNVTAHHYGAHS